MACDALVAGDAFGRSRVTKASLKSTARGKVKARQAFQPPALNPQAPNAQPQALTPNPEPNGIGEYSDE